MKLLDTNASNTKIAKTVGKSMGKIRMASLSMMPTPELCPSSKAAGCFEDCLKSAGRGRFDNVAHGRMRKTEFFNADRPRFLRQLMRELGNFDKLCKRQGVKGVVRLNVLSDIAWEEYQVPQSFPDLEFYDYSKRGLRIQRFDMYHKRGELMNYRLMFSYSDRSQYANQVNLAMDTDVPVAVVFKNGMPESFMGRKVIDGDQSDWDNLHAGRVVVGLRAKGKAKKNDTGFVVDASNLIAMA